MPSNQELFNEARELIKTKKYDEAWAILMTIDDPKAEQWLQKLEAFQAKLQTKKVQSRNPTQQNFGVSIPLPMSYDEEKAVYPLGQPRDPWKVLFDLPQVWDMLNIRPIRLWYRLLRLIYRTFIIIIIKPFELLMNWRKFGKQTEILAVGFGYLSVIVMMIFFAISLYSSDSAAFLFFYLFACLYCFMPVLIAYIQQFDFAKNYTATYKKQHFILVPALILSGIGGFFIYALLAIFFGIPN